MKTLLAGIAKLENSYVREWVIYHLNLGFDHIIIGDNNEPDGESLLDPISDLINAGFVDAINCRSKEITQMTLYQYIYDNYSKDYDWTMFLDIDEFLFLEKDKTVNEYLSREVFNDFNSIKINWKIMGDSDQLINTGEPVLQRLTKEGKNPEQSWKPDPNRKIKMNYFVKSFVRPNIPETFWDDAPQLIPKNLNAEVQYLKLCDNKGDTLDQKYIDDTCLDYTDYTLAYIKHFRTKTIEEYISNKCMKGWPITTVNDCRSKEWIESYLNLDFFFSINEFTQEKLDLAYQLMEKYNINLK